VRVGLPRSVAGPGAQRFDPNLDSAHHHFRCLRCGELFDVHPEGAEGLTPREGGFQVTGVQILLEGTCPDCARAASAR
jgi:Fe2+ or Zn2+ uptake regulation protein